MQKIITKEKINLFNNVIEQNAEYKVALEKLIKYIVEFEDFVHEIKDGYNPNLEINDFDNDLSMRKIIEDQLRLLPPDVAALFRKDINQIDRVFLKNTIQLKDSLLNTDGYGITEYAIYSRGPKNIRDFISEEFIDHYI